MYIRFTLITFQKWREEKFEEYRKKYFTDFLFQLFIIVACISWIVRSVWVGLG